MTDSRTFYIEAVIRLADGSTISHSETHETHVPCPSGRGVLVGYSSDFAHRMAEEAAAELGGEVEDVDFGYYERGGIDWSALDLY